MLFTFIRIQRRTHSYHFESSSTWNIIFTRDRHMLNSTKFQLKIITCMARDHYRLGRRKFPECGTYRLTYVSNCGVKYVFTLCRNINGNDIGNLISQLIIRGFDTCSARGSSDANSYGFVETTAKFGSWDQGHNTILLCPCLGLSWVVSASRSSSAVIVGFLGSLGGID
jgi:hypothetical protein